MPTELEHIDKWKKNRTFLATIDPKYSDWRATVAFYAALHAVEAYFWAKLKRDCHSHETRDPVIQRELPAIYPDYHQLYSASRIARYMVFKNGKWPLFDQFLPAPKVEKILIKQRMHRLEQHIIQQLALPIEDFPEIFPPSSQVPK